MRIIEPMTAGRLRKAADLLEHAGGMGLYPERLRQWADDFIPAPSPSDLSVLVELASLTTDRTPTEQAALVRVAAYLDARSGLTIHTETVG